MEGDGYSQQQTHHVTFDIDATAATAAASTAMSAEALLSQKSDRLVDGDAQIPILIAEQPNGSARGSRSKTTKPLTLLPLVALIFYDVSGGPFGIEVTTTLLHLPCAPAHRLVSLSPRRVTCMRHAASCVSYTPNHAAPWSTMLPAP